MKQRDQEERVRAVQQVLRTFFQDDALCYDHSRFLGGMTNDNYLVTVGGADYVVREPGFQTERIIDRDSEHANSLAASDLGINLECLLFDKESGVKVSRFLDRARTFTAIDPAADRTIQAVASLLRRVHAGSSFANTFCWERELDKYEDIVISLDGDFFAGYEQQKQRLKDFIRDHVTRLRSVPCHNDTVPENFLMDSRSRRSYLIDWEYSGLNDPAWDVAMYITESGLGEAAVEKLLRAYYGPEPLDSDELMKLKCMSMAQDLLWSVWALIRHYNGEDFMEYLSHHYNRFRRNLEQLSRDEGYPLYRMAEW